MKTVLTATGPLWVNPSNPRYFENLSDGKAVYLTGTHTWNNLQDTGNPISCFNYTAYLDFLVENRMNFIRLWAWENPRWAPWSGDDGFIFDPLPYSRTGPGTASDRLPKFNLDVWNQAYFDRLAERVEEAGIKGVYVGIMLFSGCSIGNRDWPATDSRTGLPAKNPWDSHPYNRENNINGMDGDRDEDGQGWELRDIKRIDILERQKAYIRKVVDTVNCYDNVLYEIANEDPFDTREWQYEIIRYIKEYESVMPEKHPVGMTASWKQPNDAMYKSPADWISPYYDENEAIDPLTACGDKVWLADTDHVFPNMGVTMDFAWKAFLRGANIISMDNRKTGEAWEYFRKKAGGNVERFEPDRAESLSQGIFIPVLGDVTQKYTKMYADRLDLSRVSPCSQLSSTTYCLAYPEREYIIYQPDDSPFTVDLSNAFCELRIEWFNPVTGEVIQKGTVRCGETICTFIPPCAPSVLYLSKIETAIDKEG